MNALSPDMDYVETTNIVEESVNLIVGFLFQENKAEETSADDGHSRQEEAERVLEAGITNALGRTM